MGIQASLHYSLVRGEGKWIDYGKLLGSSREEEREKAKLHPTLVITVNRVWYRRKGASRSRATPIEILVPSPSWKLRIAKEEG